MRSVYCRPPFTEKIILSPFFIFTKTAARGDSDVFLPHRSANWTGHISSKSSYNNKTKKRKNRQKKKKQQDLFSIASLPFCKDRIYKSSFAPSIYVVVCSFLTV